MRKILILMMSLVLVFSFFGCGSEQENENADEPTIKEILEEQYGLVGGKPVRNDKTGNWYIETISNSNANDPMEWAETYYNEYGKPGAVLFVVNFANNTTTMLRNDSQDGLQLLVEQHEYVDGEEHDANILPSGEVLSSKYLSYNDEGKLEVLDLDN